MNDFGNAAIDNYLIAMDDDRDLLDIIERAAGEMGFRISALSDPDHFKSAVRQEDPSIILLDLQMPNCDGVELLRHLHEQKCKARIVLMSGVETRLLQMAKDMGSGLGLNMAPPMYKPLRLNVLRSTLRTLITEMNIIDGELLKQALNENQITAYYQPMISLATRRVVGWEALVRWKHPERGLIMPDRFITIAERSFVIDALTDRVLELAVAQAARWHGQGRDMFVSINLSPQNLADQELPDRIDALCRKANLPTNLIRLELTESAAMHDGVRLAEMLLRLRLKGFKLAIDDFGTGFSSLLQLYRLPFSELKIDQAFVRDMTSSQEASIIINATIKLAQALNLELVAEGIETVEIANRLQALGCQIGQGYHFGRPMPAQDAEAFNLSVQ